MTYRGKVMNRAARINGLSKSGQVWCSSQAWQGALADQQEQGSMEDVAGLYLGAHKLKGVQVGAGDILSLVRTQELEVITYYLILYLLVMSVHKVQHTTSHHIVIQHNTHHTTQCTRTTTHTITQHHNTQSTTQTTSNQPHSPDAHRRRSTWFSVAIQPAAVNPCMSRSTTWGPPSSQLEAAGYPQAAASAHQSSC